MAGRPLDALCAMFAKNQKPAMSQVLRMDPVIRFPEN